jgi:hypothetical protein
MKYEVIFLDRLFFHPTPSCRNQGEELPTLVSRGIALLRDLSGGHDIKAYRTNLYRSLKYKMQSKAGRCKGLGRPPRPKPGNGPYWCLLRAGEAEAGRD